MINRKFFLFKLIIIYNILTGLFTLINIIGNLKSDLTLKMAAM